MASCIVNLFNFTQRKRASEFGNNAHALHRPGFQRSLQRRRNKKVAYQHGNMVVPHGIHRRRIAPRARLVYNIVVNKRGVMQHLYSRGTGNSGLGHLSQQLRAKQHKHRAYLLPISLQIVFDNLIHQRVGRMQGLADVAV